MHICGNIFPTKILIFLSYHSYFGKKICQMPKRNFPSEKPFHKIYKIRLNYLTSQQLNYYINTNLIINMCFSSGWDTQVCVNLGGGRNVLKIIISLLMYKWIYSNYFTIIKIFILIYMAYCLFSNWKLLLRNCYFLLTFINFYSLYP